MLYRSFSAVVSGLHVQSEVAPTENNIKLYFLKNRQLISKCTTPGVVTLL